MSGLTVHLKAHLKAHLKVRNLHSRLLEEANLSKKILDHIRFYGYPMLQRPFSTLPEPPALDGSLCHLHKHSHNVSDSHADMIPGLTSRQNR